MKRFILVFGIIIYTLYCALPPQVESALLIPDARKKSGVTPLLDLSGSNARNALQFMNELRRRCAANVYLVETVDEDDNVTTYDPPELVETFRIPSAQKLEGLIGSIIQKIQGNTALTPAYSDPVKLEIPTPTGEKCREATYEVHVVGPGVYYEDGMEITTYDEESITMAQMEVFFYDIALPTILLAVNGANMSKYFEGKIHRGLESTATLAKFSSLIESALIKVREKNDWIGAAIDFFKQFNLSDKHKQALIAWLVKMVKEELKDEAKQNLENIFKKIDLSEYVMSLADVLVVLKDVTNPDNNMANQWIVYVTPSTLRIEPASSVVSYGGNTSTLTVEIKDGGQPYESENLRYLWVSEHNLGTLSASDGASGYEIYTSTDVVEYTSSYSTSPRLDTVTVTVDEGGIEVGSASAKVYGNDTQVYSSSEGCLASVTTSRSCPSESGGWCPTVDCATCVISGENCVGSCVEDVYVYVYYPVGSCDARPCVCYSYYINPENGWCGWIPDDKCIEVADGSYYIELFWALNPEMTIEDLLKENCHRMHLMQKDKPGDEWSCPCEQWCSYYAYQ